MKQNFILLLLALFLSIHTVHGQDNLTSDRPGQTFSAHTVGRNVFQIQSGFGYNQLQYRDLQSEFFPVRNDYRKWSAYNATDLRFGLLESLDIGLTVLSTYDDIVGEEVLLPNPYEPQNNYDAYLSLRYNLLHTKHWSVGVLAAGLVNLKELNLRAMASYNINTGSSLNSNIAYRTTSVNRKFNQLAYTLNFSHGFDKIGFFVETFAEIRLHQGDFHYTDWQNYFDAGLWYLVNNNLQLDLAIGTGFNDQFIFLNIEESSRLFAEIGLTYRIK